MPLAHCCDCVIILPPIHLWHGIHKIRPGHYRQIDLAESVPSHRDCYYAFKGKAEIKGSRTELSKVYASKIEAAVKRQLLGDVEIGVMLSGGIDSAVVAALAQKNSEMPLKAFTIGFEGDYVEDEIEEAAETAELLGLQHHYRRISFADFLSQIEHCTKIVEEPLATHINDSNVLFVTNGISACESCHDRSRSR